MTAIQNAKHLFNHVREKGTTKMNIRKMTVVAMASATTVAVAAAVPQVTNVTMAQASGGRTVTISYTLTDAPAVVTLEVQTNANTSAVADDPGWTSIGGEAVCNAQGDVWKRVETGSRTITWRPDQSWPDHVIANGGARAKVTAWALDNTPDYMVVDISAAAQPNTQKYYPAVDFLPGAFAGQTGAITNNIDYRTTRLVMRKVMAKDVEWTMGSTPQESPRDAAKEATHTVQLTNNYYIGVFEVTQTQWSLIDGDFPSYFTTERALRPIEQVSYNRIRMANKSNAAASGAPDWPAPPFADSFLGRLNARTGLDFDLPSEAQWEFACRAGNGDGRWGDGSDMLSVANETNLSRLGRYNRNGGYLKPGTWSDPRATWGVTNGTAACGSYLPNSWGIYDMHGNVREWCLDLGNNDISSLRGAIYVDPGRTNAVCRGGTFMDDRQNCRPAFRASVPRNNTYYTNGNGFRVACTAGLQ